MKRLTLWLRPDAHYGASLEETLTALRTSGTGPFAEELHAPFLPHVTLGSGLATDAAQTAEAVELLGRGMPPLVLTATALHAPDPEEAAWSFWRSLALGFAPDAGWLNLTEASERVTNIGLDAEARQVPHLSLHYSRLPRQRKLTMLQRNNALSPLELWPTVRFDSLALVEGTTPLASPLDRIAAWHVLATAPLLGA